MNKLALLFLVSNFTIIAQTTLTHNVGTNIIETSLFSCSGGPQLDYGRIFVLEDFGIASNEDFVINTGNVGFSEFGCSVSAEFQFNIYYVDSNFPTSFSENDLIGSSQPVRAYCSSQFSIFEINFDTPVVVPAGTDRILVVARQLSTTSSPWIFIGGTAQDSDLSWVKGSCLGQTWQTSIDINRPDARIYVTAIGDRVLATNEYALDNIAVYPNPTSDTFNISGISEGIVKIFEFSGRVLKVFKIENESLNLSGLANGMYIISITSNNRTTNRSLLKH